MRNDAGVNGDAQRIEQIVWILFLKIYDAKEEDWELVDDDYESIIPEACKWREWAVDNKDGKARTGDELLDFVNNTLFPTLKNLEIDEHTPINQLIVKYAFEDANNYQKDGVLLRQVVNIIDEIDFTEYEERHAFGTIYESFLKDLQSAGNAGEFYTPRAVTDFIVQVIHPILGERIADFACGTGGFLVSALKELDKQVGNSLEKREIYNRSIYGVEKKALPHILCVTNMLLHDIDNPDIVHGNTLETDYKEHRSMEQFDVVLMNPPYGGNEKSQVKKNFPADMASGETSDLFVALIMYRLKKDGRAAIVLPEGFLTGTDNAKIALKKKLLTEFNLHTIVKLPNTTFAPYATVATYILFFDAGKPTDDIWFYQHNVPKGQKNYSKTKPIQLSEFEAELQWWNNREENENAWNISIDEIIENNYKIDFKNPNVQDEQQKWDPICLMEDVIENYDYISKLCKEIDFKVCDNYSVKEYKIGEICGIEKGKSPIKKTQPGEYPLVVTAEERLSSVDYQLDREAVCIPLVSSTGHGHASMKRIHYQKGKFALGNILCALYSTNEEILLTKYLYIYLSYHKDDLLVKLMKGTTNVSLSMKDILSATINVPSIDVQLEVIERIEKVNMISKKIAEVREQEQEFERAYYSLLLDKL